MTSTPATPNPLADLVERTNAPETTVYGRVLDENEEPVTVAVPVDLLDDLVDLLQEAASAEMGREAAQVWADRRRGALGALAALRDA